MKLAIAIIAVFLLVAACILLIGHLLHPTRSGSTSRTILAPSQVVRDTILDAESQSEWRKSVKSVERTSEKTWIESTSDGDRIEFQILESTDTEISLGFKSKRGFTGRWDAQISKLDEGGTRLFIREQSATPNPIIRIVSRLFFNPTAFAEKYLEELAIEVENRMQNGE